MLRAIDLLALAAEAAGAQVNYIVPGALGDVPYHGRWTMDLYAPKCEPRPAAIIIHGSRGNRRGYISRLCEQATRAGYAWFAPDYGSEADVGEALRFIRQPNRFNLESRLVLIGEDTGARIALNLASRERVAGVATVGAKVDDAAQPS